MPGTGLVAGAGALVGVGVGVAAADPLTLVTTAVALAVVAAALHHLLARLEVGRLPRLAVIAATVANPALVTTTSTARGAVLLAGLLATLAGLARWSTATRTPSGGELAVYAGLPATAAAFAGTEGWLLVVVGAAAVTAVELVRGHGWHSGLTRGACFAVVPVLAAAWWSAREVVQGRPPADLVPVVAPTLSAAATESLLCVLLAAPVAALVSGLVRREQHRLALQETS